MNSLSVFSNYLVVKNLSANPILSNSDMFLFYIIKLAVSYTEISLEQFKNLRTAIKYGF